MIRRTTSMVVPKHTRMIFFNIEFINFIQEQYVYIRTKHQNLKKNNIIIKKNYERERERCK